MRLLRASVFLAIVLSVLSAHAEKPWPIRAVIVTTFETGNDTGDAPGEFQFWVEREHLDQIIAFPGGALGPDGKPHALRTNKDHTILGMVSGTTLVNATASMMALGLDPRFDLTHAYILINGIAGIDPHIGSIGSAAWARYVIGDVAREIDPREAPKDWPYGIFPTSAKQPNPPSIEDPLWHRSNLFTLNQSLVQWAYEQTRSLKLPDDPAVAAFRAEYTDTPAAQRPPFVLLGDTFASDYYWHGTIMTTYAEDWVHLWTHGKGVFATTEMEDSGFLNAIDRLDDMHCLDRNRVLVLRTGSNYSMERPGHDAVESVTAPYIGKNLALESAYLVGSAVLHNLLANWPTTRDHIPGN
ncbi:MAG TPA: purine nucleoside permease [Bryocella sp.]|nr:purine nucleoside permease [Bryocella sp.]